MSHEIYKEKFLSYQQPAWHGLGTVLTEQIGATEAGRRIQLPNVVTEPVVTASGLATDHKAIIGIEGDVKTIYDVVTNAYHEITHERFLESWERGTGNAYVETIGLLYNGSTLFLTTKLPNFAVKGDEVAAYLLAFNPLKKGQAATVRKTPVRVVCNNTLQASGSNFSAQWRVIHTQQAAIQLEAFLKDAYEQAVAEYQTVKEFYEILASRNLTDAEAKDAFKEVYYEPALPVNLKNLDVNDTEALKKLAAWEREKGAQIQHRDKTFALYAGDGVGALSDAAKGTAWGAYNAVVEYEQHLKKFRQGASVVFGAGRDRIVKAYNVLAEVAGIDPKELAEDEVAA